MGGLVSWRGAGDCWGSGTGLREAMDRQGLCQRSTSFFFFFFVFLSIWATPMAYGGSQARGRIRAVAARLCHNYSNARFEPHSSWQRPILNPLSKARDRTHNLRVPSQIRFHCATRGTPPLPFNGSCSPSASRQVLYHFLIPSGSAPFSSDSAF